MTTPDPNSIEFLTMEFKLDSGTQIELVRCGKCMSLLLPADAQEHANWHGKVRTEVSMASLGFGGLGL